MISEIKNQKDYIYLRQNYNKLTGSFVPALEQATKEFFGDELSIVFLGVSKNNNPLMDKSPNFVTKVQITELFDVFFRMTDVAVSIILDNALGFAGKKFSLNKMSDLEAKIITSYNDFIYKAFSNFLVPPPPTVARSNYDVINLTFLIKDENSGKCGKFIVTVPQVLLNFEESEQIGHRDYSDTFKNSKINVDIKVGTTKFSLYDLKNIAIEDIVIFENSKLEKFELKYNDYENIINVKPNMGLVLPVDEDEGIENMGDNINLWDSIEVEINAQFESVKITLGELKAIEAGTVIDLTSIYNNKVTLSVENKPIAKGELVIINDRYGVKITDVADTNEPTQSEEILQELAPSEVEQSAEPGAEDEFISEEGDAFEHPVSDIPGADNSDEDFDYSDFELEDEDI